MGNVIAQIMLLGWPVVALVLFLTMSTQRAIVVTLVGGFILLPYGLAYNFPGVPPLDKASIPNMVAFVLALVLGRSGEFRWVRSLPVNLLLLLYVVGPFATGYANPDAIQIGSMTMPGLTLYDSLSSAAGRAIELIPFILGAGLLNKERAHHDILLVFVAAALVYTPPMLLEIVKGPLFQVKLYGIDPSGFFIQQARGNSFRALVLMGHGLLVSFFIGLSVLASIGLWRSRSKIWGLSALLCAVYLSGVLVLDKSMGALIFVFVIGPLAALLTPRRFLTIALAVGLVLVAYPALRAAGFIPIDTIRTAASSFSEERGGSLEFRLRNEDILLDRANQRPLFGWGGWNRNRVFVLTGWGTTTDVSVTDGTWIIILGTNGCLGYIALFGLLCYPFWHLYRRRRAYIPPATIALVSMLLCNVLDLIPNSSLEPVTWLIAGALAGFTAVRTQRPAPQHLVGASGAPPEKALAAT